MADPQGASFNLFKPAQVGWHELHTNDEPKAFNFYSTMFGWLKGDALDMGVMGT